MSGADLRIGLVGCGRLAELGYLPALEAASTVELAAVADPDPVRRARVAEQGGGVPAFSSNAAMLGAGVADALVLASPTETHLDDARLGAEAGLAVLVEKPPAPDAPGAASLAALRPAPWMGFNRRFTPGIGEVRAVASALDDVSLDLCLEYRRQGWRPHAVRQDVLADLGPHLVDLARWLSGRAVTAVRAVAAGSDRATIELALADGGGAHLRVANDRPHRELVEARAASTTGANGGLVPGGGRRDRPLARHREGGPTSGIRRRLSARREPHPLVASLTTQLHAFAVAASGGDPGALATAGDGVAGMEVLDAARASAGDGGRTVTVPAGVGA